MKNMRSQAGVTVLELAMSATLAVGVLGAAGMMIDASSHVAQSTNDQGAASLRVGATLYQLTDAVRRGSLASARHVDGTNFDDGTSDAGFQIRFVTGYNGAPITSGLITYRWDHVAGAPEGDVIRDDGGIQTILARHVTNFGIARAGNLFTITLTARSGPQDDRARSSIGQVEVTARNP
jgi:hypothetical protein